MNAQWNAPISDRFSSLCARVFSPAAAILESEKTLGTRLVLPNIHFLAAMKALVLGNLFKLLDLSSHFHLNFATWGIKMKKNMTIVLFFFISPMADCPCECDGKSNKLE